jgi:release factor glutamine methyltransferase
MATIVQRFDLAVTSEIGAMGRARITERQLDHLARVRSGPQRLTAAWPCDLELPPGVAEPKIDSQLLALAALPYAHGSHLDLFSGSGVVGAWLRGRVERTVLTDISPAAVDHLRRTVASWPLETSVLLGDVFDGIKESFDVITANSPYVDRPINDVIDKICFDKDHQATRKFIREVGNYLKPCGSAFITWANFADFHFLETLLSQTDLPFEACARIQEPLAREAGSSPIEYRVYRIHMQ